MSTDTLTVYQPAIDPEAITRALMAGDISKLTPLDRVQFYNALCQSCGLNWLTRPFIVMRGQDGALSWYITAAGAEQLRRLHHVSTQILSRERLDDLYIVTCQCRTPDGRGEEAQGVVPLAGLKAQELANALMRCETKAKRRATLALLGLGLAGVDEDPGMQEVRFDPQTGVLDVPPEPGETAGELLTTIGQWFRRLPKAARPVVAQQVWSMRLDELPHASLGELAAGWMRLDDGTAPLAWDSPTLEAELGQWLQRHAQASAQDLFGWEEADE